MCRLVLTSFRKIKSLLATWIIAALVLLSGCGTQPMAPSPVADTAEQQKIVITEQLQQEYQAAVDAFQNQQHQRAAELLDGILQAEPRLSAPYVLQGMVEEQRGNKPAAKHWYLEALEYDPGNHAALNQLGLIARGNGDFRQAEEFYQRAIAAAPEIAKYYLNYAILLDLYMGKLNDALEQYEVYQRIANSPDEQVALWVVDLKQRMQ